MPVADGTGMPTSTFTYQGTVALEAPVLPGRALGMFGGSREPPADAPEGMRDAELGKHAARLVPALGLGGAGGDAGGDRAAAGAAAADAL